jgi:(p)ppGpp synthase/HD superfamily hydrolase
MDKTRDLILSLPLKEMEPSLLTHSILMRSRVFLPTYSEMTLCALQMASYLHRNATRQNRHNLPKDTYITHPLRNAERLFRYGVEDPEIIIATILHDTVEDCYEEMAEKLVGRSFSTPESGRDIALDILSDTFNPTISNLVNQVTNPFSTRGISKEEKRLQYFEHVVEVVQDPKVYLIKFTDWVDNAVGLHHNAQEGNQGMVTHLSQKYFPLVQVFEENLSDKVLELVDENGAQMIREHIRAGRQSLTALMDGINPDKG